jgi:hypothetical protein
MTKPIGIEAQLAEEHWKFVKKLLEQEMKIKELLYKEGFKHGMKHGLETQHEKV